MPKSTRVLSCVLGASLASLAACSSPSLSGGDDGTGAAGGGTQSGIQFATAQQVTAKTYGCAPISYSTIGTTLVALGVDIQLEALNPYLIDPATGKPPVPAAPGMGLAQVAYTAARGSFGVGDYANRNPESTSVGTAQLAKLGDLLVQAAPEIIAGMTKGTRCKGISLIGGDGKLSREGLSCLGGQVASPDAVTLANQLLDQAVGQGMTNDQAQQLVVAGYLSALYTCR